jgi:hypothetical protein
VIVADKQTLLASNYFGLFLKGTNSSLKQTRFFWHKTDDDILLAANQSGSYIFDLKTSEYKQLTKKQILGFSQNYVLTDEGTLYRLNPRSEEEKEILAVKQKLNPKILYEIYELKNNSFLIWGSDGKVILVKQEKAKPENFEEKIISEKTDSLIINNDLTKIAFVEGNKLFIYFLENVFDDLLYRAEEVIDLGEIKQNSKDLYFANHTWYLISVFKDNLTITEIDRRQPINSYPVDIKDIKMPLLFENNVFFWLDSENRLNSAKILP